MISGPLSYRVFRERAPQVRIFSKLSKLYASMLRRQNLGQKIYDLGQFVDQKVDLVHEFIFLNYFSR